MYTHTKWVYLITKYYYYSVHRYITLLHHSSPHEKIDPSFGKSVVPGLVLVPVGSSDRQCEVVIGPQPAQSGHLERD